MFACNLTGHRVRFWTDGPIMRWECERGCGLSGEKAYSDAVEASRYARAFDRDDRDDLGKRSPLSLMPLRLGRRRERS